MRNDGSHRSVLFCVAIILAGYNDWLTENWNDSINAIYYLLWGYYYSVTRLSIIAVIQWYWPILSIIVKVMASTILNDLAIVIVCGNWRGKDPMTSGWPVAADRANYSNGPMVPKRLCIDNRSIVVTIPGYYW